MSAPGRHAAAAALCLLTLGSGVALGGATRTAESPVRLTAPLRVRNLSPATQLFGLPRPLGALVVPGTTEFVLQVEHANNFTAGGSSGATAAVFDGGATLAGFSLRRALGQRLEWGLELPYVQHSDGFTDGFIDGFHELFGLPDGGRDAAPRDRLDYRLISGGATRVRLDGAGGHLGDVRGWLGYRFHQGPGREAVLRGMVKAPSGAATVQGTLGGSLTLGRRAWLDAGVSEDLAGASAPDVVFLVSIGTSL